MNKFVCALCNEPDKTPRKNTHYLTDAIINTAINLNGVKDRDMGKYVSFDSEKPFAEFKFQSGIVELTEDYGREVTDEEIHQMLQDRVFSVDDKFCYTCEGKFGVIENAFMPKILNLFRKNDITGVTEICLDVNDSKITRLFFLMQIWRTHICEFDFNISEELAEKLRLKILYTDYEGLEDIPLSITYLQTLTPENVGINDHSYKTENVVDVQKLSNPIIILMNDFVIQLYEDLNFPFNDFFGLNKLTDYFTYLNYKLPEFKVKVIPNQIRKQLNINFSKPIAKKLAAESIKRLIVFHTQYKGEIPSEKLINEFHTLLIETGGMRVFTDQHFIDTLQKFYGVKIKKINNY